MTTIEVELARLTFGLFCAVFYSRRWTYLAVLALFVYVAGSVGAVIAGGLWLAVEPGLLIFDALGMKSLRRMELGK